MSEQACCSHSTITRITEDHPLGYRSEYWKCDTCETRFAPEPLMQGRVLRDWIAGMALQGFMARSAWGNTLMPCEMAYDYADKMLAQRDKKP